MIDPIRRDWNVDLVKQLFLPFDVDGILSIPISKRLPDDKLCWDLEKDGIYSVRSAYKMIFSDEWSAGMEPYLTDSKLWKTIWHAEVLLRVKIFVWRACLKALPMCCGLHIRIPSICVHCICVAFLGVCGKLAR